MAIGANARMGYGGIIGYGDESTWGVAAGNVNNFFEFNSASFAKNIGGKVLESLGTGRSGGRRVVGDIEIEGTINFNLHPVNGLGLLKHALMGTVTSAALSATAYVHTFTAGNLDGIDEQGMTMHLRPSNTTQAFVITGARVNSFKISAETGGEAVTAEVSIIAKSMTTGTFITSGSVAFNVARPFLPQDVTVSIDGSNEDIISLELTCPENNLQNDGNARSLGSRTLTVLPPQKRGLGLTLTQRFDTTTAWNRHENASAMTIMVDLTSSEVIGADTTTYRLHCKLPKVYYDSGGPPEVGESGILTHELSIVPVLDTLTGGQDIVFSAWNEITSY